MALDKVDKIIVLTGAWCIGVGLTIFSSSDSASTPTRKQRAQIAFDEYMENMDKTVAKLKEFQDVIDLKIMEAHWDEDGTSGEHA